ncbi:MAG: lipopolysaccharide biosynthesis protein [Actinomycetota bacterium]
MIERMRAAGGRMTGADGSMSMAAAGTLSISLVGTAVRFVLQVLLANWMTQAAYGLFLVGRSWGELLAKVPSRGYKLSAVRQLPRYEHDAAWPAYRGFVRRSSLETLVLGIAITLAAAVIYAAGTDRVDGVFLAGFALAPALALSSLWRSILQAGHRYVPALGVTELAQPLAFAVGVGAVAAATDLSPTVAVALWTASVAATAAIQWLMHLRWRPGPRRVAPDYADRRRWAQASRTDFVAQLALAAMSVLDLILVGWLLGPTEAALYGVASRVAVLGRIVNSGLESVVSPRITAAHARGDVPAIQGLVDQSIRVSTWPTVAFGVGVAALATPILRVFDDTYVDARSVLWILLAGNLVNALTGPSGFVISMTGYERPYAWIMATHAVLLGVAVWAFAGPHGILGVAVARTAVTVSWNAVLSTLAWRRLRVRCYPRPAVLLPRR